AASAAPAEPSLMEESATAKRDIRVSERPNRILRQSAYARQEAANEEFDSVMEDELPHPPVAGVAPAMVDPESDQEEAAMEAATGKVRELSLLENEEVKHISVNEGIKNRIEPHHLSRREPGIPPPPPLEQAPPPERGVSVSSEDNFVVSLF